ncbi:hypothetical protein HYU19_02700 [Candidatus Woesearchaeota archaeon]|nr:hypothetical protein [Candidatus Woesearchaeota archaeon]
MTQLSNKTLGMLLAVAVLAAFGGAIISFQYLGTPAITGLAVDTSVIESDGAITETVPIPISSLPLDDKNQAVISVSNTLGVSQDVELTADGTSVVFDTSSFQLGPSQNEKVLVTVKGKKAGTIKVMLTKKG